MNAPDHIRRWETRRLRDAVTKLVDGSHNPPPKQKRGRPMLSARNIENGQILFDNFRFISDESFAVEHARTRVTPGDVLLTIVGTIGRATVVPESIAPFALQRSVAVLSPKQDLLPKFLSFQLQSPAAQRYFGANARGTAQKGIYLKILGEAPIGIPPLDEQREIVAEIEKQFSRLDKASANVKSVKARLAAYRASVLSAVQSGTLCGMSYSDWPVRTIGELATKVQYGSSAKTSSSEKGIPVLRMGNIENGELVLDDLKYLPADHNEFPELLLENGDLLFNRTNSPELVGKVGVYKNNPSPCSFASYLIRLRFPNEVVPDFVAYVLSSPIGRAWVRSVVSQQVGQANVNGSKLKAFQFRLPPTNFQRKLVAEAERLLSMMRETETQLAAAERRSERLRGRLLANAFPKLRAYEK